jgi:hypothetical protein
MASTFGRGQLPGAEVAHRHMYIYLLRPTCPNKKSCYCVYMMLALRLLREGSGATLYVRQV